MEALTQILPIIIDILLIVLLVSGIILIIKCIYIIDKAKSVVLNVEEKVNSLNSLFAVVSLVNDKIVSITDKVVDGVSGLIGRIFRNKKKKRQIEEDE